ncbi:hypothetical protein [Lacticaseibacillus chiayiensis]|uniref:Uncharacterized protein n=1 Tax=Lacticaseibacillus chiayiensis TaxID=2100821 RepID=A0ABY6H2K5_9LACO|nr:hypothetical protein [Lacticaseibacillus chiayiensis]QVI33827.1 hypothetical protein KG086_08355 [Lacticaseibacillus chiayiensis]UYN55574.1 hypothetical protein OFW50_08695 [Lacticaseibacillus chiayiensis]
MSKSENTDALARFIVSLGSMNDYGITVYQTKLKSNPLNRCGRTKMLLPFFKTPSRG